MSKILVIGSINVDYSIKTSRMPVKGETVIGDEFKIVCGGKGANQAYALGKLGAEVSMIGAVGNDSNGILSIDNLKNVNVDISGIEIIDNLNTGCAFVTVDNTADNCITVIPGANNAVTKELILKHINLLLESNIIIMQLEIPIDTVKYVIDFASKNNKTIILDPAPARENILDDVLDKIDYIKPNETELSILTKMPVSNIDEIKNAAKKLNNKGVKNLLITLGKNGALLINNDEITHFETENVEVVDTTAAGDTFLAVFTLLLDKGYDIHNCIEKANKVAAYVCTKRGAQSSIPSINEIESIFN